MSYIEQTRKEIIEAYVFLRTNNITIPSETLEFMKDSSLKALDQALTIPDVVGQSEQFCEHAVTDQKTLRCACCEECGEILDVLD